MIPIRRSSSAVVVFLSVLSLVASAANGQQLSVGHDANTCPSVFETVRELVKAAVGNEPLMGGTTLEARLSRLLRQSSSVDDLRELYGFDCLGRAFSEGRENAVAGRKNIEHVPLVHQISVQGRDASLLLDVDGSEKDTPPNRSVRGYEVIDSIKEKLNADCGTNTISCADIVVIAARDSVVELGGPSYSVPLGRRDSTTGSPDAVSDLPSPQASMLDLMDKFGEKGFSPREMVALSGAHTVGMARCVTFRERIYNDDNIDPFYRTTRQAECPSEASQGPSGDDNLGPLDENSPTQIDGAYFQSLTKGRGLLHSDQELFNTSGNGFLNDVVTLYFNDGNAFFTDFSNAMEKMGNLSQASGTQLEVRTNCRRPN